MHFCILQITKYGNRETESHEGHILGACSILNMNVNRLKEKEKRKKRTRKIDTRGIIEIEKEEKTQDARRKIGSCWLVVRIIDYRWIKENYQSGTCDHCFSPIAEGYNCFAGGHFVCMKCVEMLR